MKKSKVVVIGALCLSVVLAFSACDVNENSDSKQESATEQSMQQADKEIGMPAITNFTERKELKNIYELRDQSNLICYAYILNQMNSKFDYLGECVGFGIPYGTEYSNPNKVTNGGNSPDTGTGNVAISQADPNLLYPSASTQATWLTMIDAKTGKQEVMYAEPNVVVYQTKLDARLCENLPAGY